MPVWEMPFLFFQKVPVFKIPAFFKNWKKCTFFDIALFQSWFFIKTILKNTRLSMVVFVIMVVFYIDKWTLSVIFRCGFVIWYVIIICYLVSLFLKFGSWTIDKLNIFVNLCSGNLLSGPAKTIWYWSLLT